MGFISWLYPWGVKDILAIASSLFLLLLDNFSIRVLLGSLFDPWRKDVEHPAHADISLLLNAFAMNIMSRLIGLFVRLATIFIGIGVIIATIFLGLPLIFALLLAPIVIPLMVVGGVIFMTVPELAWLALILLAYAVFALIILMTLYNQAKRNPPLATPLNEIVKNGALLRQLLPYLVPDIREIAIESMTIKEFLTELLGSGVGSHFLARLGLISDTIVSQPFASDLTVGKLISASANTAASLGHKRVEVGDLLLTLSTLDPNFAELLRLADIAPDDLANVSSWFHTLWGIENTRNPLLDPKHLRTTGGIGRDWSAGYTRILEEVGFEMTEAVSSQELDNHFLAHRKQIDEIERILARSGRNNVLLVGEPGVGKKTIAWGLAGRIHFGQSLQPLSHKRMFGIDLSAVLAGDPGVLEMRLTEVFNEAVQGGNIILFIDGIDRLFSSDPGASGTINASEILLPYLNSHRIQLIGATSPRSYHTDFESNQQVKESFETIEVNEPSAQESTIIALESLPTIENRHKVFFTYKAVKEAVITGERYLSDHRFPQKAIDILDEVAVYASADKGLKLISAKEVDELISQKSHIPVGKPENEERQVLLNLEEILHKRLINQEEAIKELADAMRRARAGIASDKRPIGSFLFLGPTGVGKTETAKTLAEAYFGSEEQMVRVDMSEYQTTDAIARLIGDGTNPGTLTSAVRDNPFSLVLLDEIEKAHPGVLDLFLQMIDDGRLTDGLGQTVKFTNTIIIATSNAGSNLIRQMVTADSSTEKPVDMVVLKAKLLDFVQNEGIFRPEFLNRFDGVLAYRPLTLAELEKVVVIMLGNLNITLEEKGITVELTPEAVGKLARIGFDPQFGARALARAMKETVENIVAQKLLSEEVGRGTVIKIDQI